MRVGPLSPGAFTLRLYVIDTVLREIKSADECGDAVTLRLGLKLNIKYTVRSTFSDSLCVFETMQCILQCYILW